MTYLVTLPIQFDSNPMPQTDPHTRLMPQSSVDSLESRISGPEAGRPSVTEILDLLRTFEGEDCREDRIRILRLATKNLSDSRKVKLMLLREIYPRGSGSEISELALLLSDVVPAHEEDCALVQQCLMHSGLIAESVEFAERAIVRHPDFHHLRHNLGVSFRNLGRLTEALEAFRGAVEVQPYADASITMAGSLLRELGRLDEALEFHGAAVRIAPTSSVALYNLGNSLLAKGELVGAVDAYKRAAGLRADWPELLNNLSATLVRLDRHLEAIPHLIALCRLRADSAADIARLAFTLREANRPAEALELADVLVARAPKESKYRMLRGACLVRVGRAEEAVREYRQAIALNPSDIEGYNSLIYAANYLPHERPEELFAFYKMYSGMVEGTGLPKPFSGVPPEPFPRKMRIGYVSGDFCHHPVTTFIEPVLERHDGAEFEVFCYYNNTRVDAFTRKLQSLPVQWRQVQGLSDEAFCDLVGKDKIDVLVDLSGHTTRNRLTAFARKPAPVQVTMVGCMQTTGLRAMDYRITDAGLDPEGLTEAFHSERLVRMQSGAVCFRPHPSAPEVAPLPCLSGKPFTFGSFNNLAKITAPVLDLWATVLASVPESRMQVVADSDEFFLREMQKRGIAKERFIVLRRMAEVQYLEAHAAVDLLLDTFPFNGLTITANALWMGVPCVTLSGNTSASRAGTSLLARLGLERFATSSREEYARTAVYHAANPGDLAEVRASLRRNMQRVWADAVAYTRELESQFRGMWLSVTGQAALGPVPSVDIQPSAEVSPQYLRPDAQVGPLPKVVAAPTIEATPSSAHEEKKPSFDLAREVQQLADSQSLSGGIDVVWERFRSVPDAELKLSCLQEKLVGGGEEWRQLVVCGAFWKLFEKGALALRCFELAGQGAASAADWTWLGEALLRLGMAQEALAALKKASALPGVSAQALLGLGCLLVGLNQSSEAEPILRRTIGLSPSTWEAYCTLANCLYRRGRFREALLVARPVLRSSEDPRLLLNLASYHEKCGELVEAIQYLERAIEKSPNFSAAYMNLGNCFLLLGMLDGTLAAYQKGLSLSPDSPHLHSNLLHTLTYSPDVDQATAFSKHREFARKFESPLLPHKPHSNTRDPERRLRIAYVSPDLRMHSVCYFVEPMLQHHDHSQFEVFGVPSYTWKDGVTDRLRSYCDHWIDAGSMSDEALAEAVRDAGIDIVVDLICHSNHSRVLMLARKPAPLQITMIGMQQTTGLDSVDYRVTDAVMDPPGLTEQFHSEKLLRLPVAFVFNPPSHAPAVRPLPALQNGFITFGSFNNFAKVNDGVRNAWIRVLQAVPNSRFVCVVPSGTGFEAALAEAGIAADRVTFSPRLHSVAYLELHSQVDFILDTFPFAGLTVSAMAAWMGVPTLTIAGKTSAARAGASLQHSLGLDEFIADNPEDFVEKAVGLASDPAHLAEIRSSMRERMAAQFTDAGAYMRSFEAALRQAWREWCAQKPDKNAGA
jgi:protein O-GlcNAc transferase